MAGKEVVLPAAQGPVYRVGGEKARMLTSAEDTGGAYELFEFTGPAESGPRPHSHAWGESYLVIVGEIEVTIGDRTAHIGPGGYAHVPADTTHAYRILSARARFMVTTTGRGASPFFIELDRAAGSAPGDTQKIIEIARKHGVIAVPTPKAA